MFLCIIWHCSNKLFHSFIHSLWLVLVQYFWRKHLIKKLFKTEKGIIIIYTRKISSFKIFSVLFVFNIFSAVYPGILDPFHIVSYHMEMVMTFWTYSLIEPNYGFFQKNKIKIIITFLGLYTYLAFSTRFILL